MFRSIVQPNSDTNLVLIFSLDHCSNVVDEPFKNQIWRQLYSKLYKYTYILKCKVVFYAFQMYLIIQDVYYNLKIFAILT